ncbi:NACHT domain-containing protein [Catellatospora sp. NPDC049133]|uniref:NACHT domain-containing protein n=1 Tax=Catellatospora sp. NPDC049133 TaxID=3155499 RepID=UPI0033FF73F1
MNEIVAAIIAEFAKTLVMRVGASLVGPKYSPDDVDLDIGLYVFTTPGGDQIGFDHTQLEAIKVFLGSPEVTALTQAYVAVGAYDRRSRAGEWAEAIVTSFHELFTGAVTSVPNINNQASEIVWELVTLAIRKVLPASEVIARVPKEDLRQLFEPDRGLLEDTPAPLYIRLLIGISNEPSKLVRLRQLCSDISRAVEQAAREIPLEHTQDNHRIANNDLYIRRQLTPTKKAFDGHGETVSLEDPYPGTNLVVIGHPGAGKSTLARKLALSLAERPDRDIAPIIVKCRDFTASSTQIPLEQIAATVNMYPGISVEPRDVEDLLAAGRLFVVFDGVDELVDIQQRRQQIAAIELLSGTFPLASFLCTTRKIGYESASFAGLRFNVLELQEYTSAQVREYVSKWFALMGRSQIDTASFLRESAEIAEIRRNPLMLSLLCTLYRVRGYIPMNRHDVYRDCAELLFYGWDSLRHIPQPVDHRRYGRTLMEELAIFFYRFPRASAGVEEDQLTGLIATYFRDTAGVEASESVQRASDFLSFCATRAWLLTAVGHNSRGKRLFAFTHRTFMEFYAAEALSRRTSSEDEILDVILEEYRKNPSSVLPDLIVQAYENKSYRGAEVLLRRLLREGKEGRKVSFNSHYPLCLRILNSTPVGAPLVKDVLASAVNAWSPFVDRSDKAPFVSLLQLYKDPRVICQRILEGEEPEVLSGGKLLRAQAGFLQRWAHLWFLGETDSFHDDWISTVESIATNEAVFDAIDDASAVWYLVLAGRRSIVQQRGDMPPLFASCFGNWTAGPFLHSMQRIAAGTVGGQEHDIFGVAERGLAKRTVPLQGSETFDRVLAQLVPNMPDIAADSELVKKYPLTMLWLSCMASEASFTGVHTFHEVMLAAYDDDFLARLIRCRLETLEGADFVAEEMLDVPTRRDDLFRVLSSMWPKWVSSWARGRLSICRDVSRQ